MMYAGMKEELLEITKAAACKARMTVAQTRQGRRPMRVETMLRKDKEGSLFKGAGSYALEAGGPQGTSTPFPDEGLKGTPIALLRGKPRKGDVPSVKDEMGSVDRIDGRGSAYTQVSPSTQVDGVEI